MFNDKYLMMNDQFLNLKSQILIPNSQFLNLKSYILILTT